MMETVNAQLGRILLALAVAWTLYCVLGGSTSFNRVDFSNVPDKPVYVELNSADLAREKEETYFPKNTAAQYAGGDRCLFVPEKKIREYEAVELDVPSAPVMRPPQLLPDPGPSLEGAHKLPRFGDEFQTIPSDKSDKKDKLDPKGQTKTAEKTP